MLTRLVIQDVVLIDKLTLTLSPGLNVFTGETGAGKSIVLDALALALGARGESGLVRPGSAQASVTAEFSSLPPTLLSALADEHGLTVEEPVLLRRTVSNDGKSRAFINDQPIGVTLLKKIGEHLLEIHGQFETHGLINPSTHRALLDAFGGHEALLKKVEEAHAAWQQAVREREDATLKRAQAKAEEAFLRAAVAELDELAPEEDELDRLAQRRLRLVHHEKITQALQAATQALASERGACAALANAGKALARTLDKAPFLAEPLATVDRLGQEANETLLRLNQLYEENFSEPDALQQIEERLFALRAVARKHGKNAQELPQVHAELRERLALLGEEDDRQSILAKTVETARHAYGVLAKELSEKRRKAATTLAKRVQREFPPLKLEHARFEVALMSLDESEWGAQGGERVAFLASTNPGTQMGPLHKVASGGELSRFMLALKVVLASADAVPVLVFDEVDSGIGGATASAVGERLAKLGESVQVLVVTHSPQVAARATNHLRIVKEIKGKQAVTLVQALNLTARTEEIARMLSGAEITPAARKAAVCLLNA